MKKLLSILLSFALVMGSVSGVALVNNVKMAKADSYEVSTGIAGEVKNAEQAGKVVYDTESTSVVMDNRIKELNGVSSSDTESLGVTSSISKVNFADVKDSDVLYNLSANSNRCTIERMSINKARGSVIVVPKTLHIYYLRKIGDFGKEDGVPIIGENKINVIGSDTTYIIKSNAKYDVVHSECTVNNMGTSVSISTDSMVNNEYTLVLPSSITALEQGFARGSTKIRKVYAPEVKTIGTNAFTDCTALEDVYFPNCDTYDESVFLGCTTLGYDNLRRLPILLDFPHVRTYGKQCFKGCTSLSNINLGDMIQTLGESTFEGCVSLENIDLTGGDAEGSVATNTLRELPKKCFYNCTQLKNVSITSRLVNIGDDCFYQCNMRDFAFEKTKIQTIGNRAFYGCTKLDHVALPDVTNTVGTGCFQNCPELRYVYSINDFSAVRNLVSGDTVLQSGVKDTIAPDITRDTSSLTVNGKQLYKGGWFKITDKMNDVDLDSVTITRDGIDIKNNPVHQWTNILDVSYLNKGIAGVKFFVPNGNDGFGVYEITCQDIVGNKSTLTFDYETDVEDKTDPTITVEGDTVADYIYKSGAKVVVKDDTFLETVTVNGKVQADSTFVLDEDGYYEIVATDSSGNSVQFNMTIDGKAPVIEGVEDGDITKKAVIVKVTDDNIHLVTLNGENITSRASSGYAINVSDKYVLRAEDKAGNVSIVNFIYNANGAVISGVSNNGIYNRDVTISWNCLTRVMSAQLSTKGTNAVTDIDNGAKISTEGEHTLTVKDELGTSVVTKFTIDKTAPVIKNVTNNAVYREKSVRLDIADASKYTVFDNGKEVSSSISTEGPHKIVVRDAAGNETTVNFILQGDKTVPICNVSNGKGYKSGVTLKASSVSSVSSITLYKKSGKKYKKVKTYKASSLKVKAQGAYKAVIKDMAGATTTVTFSIDKKKPTCNLKKGKTYKKGVKIKAKDKLSPIKSITLNGRKIKNGYKLSRKGKNNIVITDAAGNKLKLTVKIK